MNRTRWIILALFTVFAIALVYVGTNPEMAERHAQAVRDSQLSQSSKDLVLGGLVIVIGAYLAWFFLVRKP
jgi:hypothetical protein